MHTSPSPILPVTQQIFEQAKSRPTAVALRYGNVTLNYAELQLRTNKLAEYLRGQASVESNVVAICLDRSAEWVITALAIMQAGGAYVPLDPTWPEARIRYAIEQSGAVALVARTSTLNRLQLTLPHIDPYRDAPVIAKTAEFSNHKYSLDALAYIIYTSGSTGTPKGVEITHANLANLVQWHRNAFSLSSDDRASHLAGLAFDATAWEIWPSLCAGAVLCIPGDAVLASPETVRNWMLQDKITIGFVPTLYAARMMDMEWPKSTKLRTLLTGGDVLHHGPKKALPFAVVNNYGPTECTVVATSAVLAAGESGVPSIGKPITGTTIYLLNENREKVAIGVPGELYIGGDKVARGYRNQPELTNSLFVPDPFTSVPGARLYRTGDRGTLRADGKIQFLGRVDRQVKIRGKRLELDEVANVLSHHPSVALATVVAAVNATNEDKHLVAYVVLKPNYVANQDELVTHLSKHLADYMIPSAFVRLPEMPVSANGKLDFSALPAPSDQNLLQSAPKEKAATLVEQQLLDIIVDLLDGKQIGVNDNVFLAGGDSLLGMQLIIALQEKLNVDVRFDQIFEAATIRDLASLVEELQKRGQYAQDQRDASANPLSQPGDESLVSAKSEISVTQMPRKPSRAAGVIPSQKTASSDPIFWIHYLHVNILKVFGQERLVTFLILTPEEIEALGETPTLNSIAALFVKKMIATQPVGPYRLGGFCMGAVLAYEIAGQLQSAGHVVADLILLDAPGPSYLKMQGVLDVRISNPLFIAKRMMKLGVRASWVNLCERVVKELRRFGLVAPEKMHRSQQLIEAAAATYEAQPYRGRTLLLLAAENAPHINFLPEWEGLIASGLDSKYIEARHDDLMKQPHVQTIADLITAHLGPIVSKSASSPNSLIELASRSEQKESAVGMPNETIAPSPAFIESATHESLVPEMQGQ